MELCGDAPEDCRNNPNLCTDAFALWRYGIFRKLESGKFEFVSICKPEIANYKTIFNTKKFNEILDKMLPEKNSVKK